MPALSVGARMQFKNVLYLTDFSERSDEALFVAKALGHAYGSQLYAVHVLVPDALIYMTPDSVAAAVELQEQSARTQMQHVEEQLTGLPHKVIVERGKGVWATIAPILKEREINLIVLGTHGRTGLSKLLLGSTAEEVFRRTSIPVMTIGPAAHFRGQDKTHFHDVLFATDFTPASLAAAPYAISFALEDRAKLILLHVIKEPKEGKREGLSVAEAMHQLYELAPPDAEFCFRPETLVEYGEPDERILEVANQRGADLIVLGIRATNYLVTATHLEQSRVHKIVAQAPCPVLTVPGTFHQGVGG